MSKRSAPVVDEHEERMRRRMEAFDGGEDSGGSESDSDEDEDKEFIAPADRAKNRMEAFDEGSDSEEDEDSEEEGGKGLKNQVHYDSASEGDSESDSEEDQEDQEEDQEEKPQLINKHTAAIGTKTSRDPSLPLSQRLNMFKSEEENAASSITNHTSSRLSARRAMKKRRAAERGDVEKPKVADDDEEDVKTGRKHKNAPAEMASNKPVRRFRDNLIDHTAKRQKAMDPRFSDLAGKLSEKDFYKNYTFLDEYQESEIKKLGRAMKKTKGVDRKTHLKGEINERKQNLSERRRALDLQERLRNMKDVEKKKVAEGKKPFFMKQSAKKAIAMDQKFDELKSTGKLKTYMAKKRVKNAKKDQRWMPASKSLGEEYQS